VTDLVGRVAGGPNFIDDFVGDGDLPRLATHGASP
jgi:hypothetical protein